MNALALEVAAQAVATLGNLKFLISMLRVIICKLFFTANILNYYENKFSLTTNSELILNTKL